jgi:inner membrane protein
MLPTDELARLGQSLRRSATFRLLGIGALILLLLIPATMLGQLVLERSQRRDEALLEMRSKWGEPQTLAGPALAVPVLERVPGQPGATRRIVHLLPSELDVKGSLAPERRSRGLFEAVFYRASLQLEGRFDRARLVLPGVAPQDVLWGEAVLELGISDLSGVAERITAQFNGQACRIEPGLPGPGLAPSGVSAILPPAVDAGGDRFRVELELNGSEELRVAPVGETTRMHLSSPWPDPSFSGGFLPQTSRVDKEGFEADWQVLDLNRNFPQVLQGPSPELANTAFGVRLFDAADVYQQSTRVAKYAVLLLVFTFAAFFLTETTRGRSVHPIHYLLVGLATLLFYLLLLALGEHLPFGLAYLLAAAAITVLVAGYSRFATGSPPFQWIVAALLSTLHGYLYLVLQLVDYALLMGSLGLLAVLAAVMFFTRRVDWYGQRS